MMLYYIMLLLVMVVFLGSEYSLKMNQSRIKLIQKQILLSKIYLLVEPPPQKVNNFL